MPLVPLSAMPALSPLAPLRPDAGLMVRRSPFLAAAFLQHHRDSPDHADRAHNPPCQMPMMLMMMMLGGNMNQMMMPMMMMARRCRPPLHHSAPLRDSRSAPAADDDGRTMTFARSLIYIVRSLRQE